MSDPTDPNDPNYAGDTENRLGVSPFTESQEYSYEQADQGDPNQYGNTDNRLIVTPIQGENYQGYDPDGIPGPPGPPGTIQFDYIGPFLIANDEIIPVSKTGQLAQIYGSDSPNTIPSVTPFGAAITETGSILEMQGFSNTQPIEFKNSRTTQFGLYINGSAVLYLSNMMQFRLVEISGLKLWREVWRNF